MKFLLTFEKKCNAASFAEVDRETSHRLAMEAQGIAGADMRGEGEDEALRNNVTERLRAEPGGRGAAFGRDEPPAQWLPPRS